MNYLNDRDNIRSEVYSGTARTLSIIMKLAKGQILTLPDGIKLGMAEDMFIGFIITDQDGNEGIGRFSELTLSQLNKILDENNIGSGIPTIK